MSTDTITAVPGTLTPDSGSLGKAYAALQSEIVELLDQIDKTPGVLSDDYAERLIEIHCEADLIRRGSYNEEKLIAIRDDLIAIKESEALQLYGTLIEIADTCALIKDDVFARFQSSAIELRNLQMHDLYHERPSVIRAFTRAKDLSPYWTLAATISSCAGKKLPSFKPLRAPIEREMSVETGSITRSSSSSTLVSDDEVTQPSAVAPLIKTVQTTLSQNIRELINHINTLPGILNLHDIARLKYILSCQAGIQDGSYSLQQLKEFEKDLEEISRSDALMEHKALITNANVIDPSGRTAKDLDYIACQIRARQIDPSPSLQRLMAIYNNMKQTILSDAKQASPRMLLPRPEVTTVEMAFPMGIPLIPNAHCLSEGDPYDEIQSSLAPKLTFLEKCAHYLLVIKFYLLSPLIHLGLKIYELLWGK